MSTSHRHAPQVASTLDEGTAGGAPAGDVRHADANDALLFDALPCTMTVNDDELVDRERDRAVRSHNAHGTPGTAVAGAGTGEQSRDGQDRPPTTAPPVEFPKRSPSS